MKNAIIIILLLLSFASMRPSSAVAETDSGQHAVVEVLVTFQEYNAILPWQREPSNDRRGFGLMLNDHIILTTESLVRNHTLIEIRRPRSGNKETAMLIESDPQVDLALLELTEATDRATIELPVMPELDANKPTANILQISASGETQAGNGRIVQWNVEELPNAPYSVLLATILTDINIDGMGAPVYTDGHWTGITLSYDSHSRTARMLPVTFIRQFIDDVQSPPYRGFASAGFSWQPLIDASKRSYFGIPAEATGGVQVLGTLASRKGPHPLKSNDIILAIDDIPIDAQGYYQDPTWGRLSFPQLIKGNHCPGDTISVTCIRDRTVITQAVELAHFDDDSLLIPENAAGLAEPYLVDGGLVLRELTGRLLKAPGKRWTIRNDPRLVHLYLARQMNVVTPGERIVILQNCLPDPINIGYQHLRNDIVTSVNGMPVSNLQQVFEAIRDTGGIHRLGLMGFGVEIALDPETLETANQRIAEQYRIPALQRR